MLRGEAKTTEPVQCGKGERSLALKTSRTAAVALHVAKNSAAGDATSQERLPASPLLSRRDTYLGQTGRASGVIVFPSPVAYIPPDAQSYSGVFCGERFPRNQQIIPVATAQIPVLERAERRTGSGTVQLRLRTTGLVASAHAQWRRSPAA